MGSGSRTPEAHPRSRVASWIGGDGYPLAGALIFLTSFLLDWRSYVQKHEAIYLLGSRRVADPDFLAADFTWSDVPPTTLLYDHLLAPLWLVTDDFGVAVVGRVAYWLLLAVSLAVLGRAMRVPAAGMAAGFAAWLLAEQTVLPCGQPLEGLQPKSLAHPLNFLALAFAIRGRAVGAGIASGLATAFHIIVGGWFCLALFAGMAVNRSLFTLRQLASFLLATAPFILPIVAVVGYFHSGGLSGGAQGSMDEIYVTFSQPHCCDPTFFMTPTRWLRSLAVFLACPLLAFAWHERRTARLVCASSLVLILLFFLGMLASRLEAYGFLKLYPFQLASALPLLFLFVFTASYVAGDAPARRLGKTLRALGLLTCLWILDDRDVLEENVPKVVRRFQPASEEEQEEMRPRGRYGSGISVTKQNLYDWIRENTPRESVFATPYLPEFWTYAERAQVAAFRHPPHDQRLIEWKERLDALNRGRPFAGRGFEIKGELSRNQAGLRLGDLIEMRDRYGATHYVTRRRRRDLPLQPVHDASGYVVYELAPLRAPE